MTQSGFISRLKQLDAYSKTLEDFSVKTFSGAVITLISSAFMILLFISELNFFVSLDVQNELFVDTARGQKLNISLNITFHRLACAFVNIDAMDSSGEQQFDVQSHMMKVRLNLDGSPVSAKLANEKVPVNTGKGEDNVPKEEQKCESCYGAESYEGQCCNTCEQVQEAYRNKGWAFNDPSSIAQCAREGFLENLQNQQNEGCQVSGYLEVNKVAGNFHFAPGKSFSQHHVHVHDLKAFEGIKFNSSHIIHQFTFGQSYPGIVNPLDETTVIQEHTESHMYQYFIKVVPTTYVKLDGTVLSTNQYSVTKHDQTANVEGVKKLPGLFFQYDLSPMMVKVTERKRSFMHFLTGLCAIIGGIFTVASLVDSVVYHSSRVIQEKTDLGKAS